MTLVIFLALGVFASWLIAKSCDGFETASDYLGRNMTEGTKGATINAIGSSMPELCVTFIYLFFFHDTTGFAGGIGTTAGSAVFNAMVIPSLVILVVLWKHANRNITISRQVVLRDGTTLILAEFFLIFFLGDTLHWYHGFTLMLIYLSYASYMIYRHKSKCNGDNKVVPDSFIKDDLPQSVTSELPSQDQEPEQILSWSQRLLGLLKIDLESAIIAGKTLNQNNAYVLLGAATAYIALACWLLVISCEEIGKSLNIHGYFVAVIIAAAASSVPDTILSMKDANKGNYDDAISNALGSNIFDICFALGAPLFLFTIIYGPIVLAPEMTDHIMELRVLLLILTIAAFIVFFAFKTINKTTAYLLLSMYVFFVLYVAGRAADWHIAQVIADKLHLIQYLIQ